jgi:signal transduction histidine kinase
MKKRSVFLYWALLLIPAVLIGAAGARLLSGEQERWNQMERAAALERARAIAQTIQLTMERAEREITDGLMAIPQENLLDSLLTWERENPNIRNVFVWSPTSGLQYPSTGEQASAEQVRFMIRYQTLFMPRKAWLPEESSDLADGSGSSKVDEKTGKASLLPGEGEGAEFRQKSASRSSERQAPKLQQTGPQAKHGWIPWFTDNTLHLLGWVQRNPSDVVFGVELETMALVSQLIEKFPTSEIEGFVYALIDDSGKLLHQLGRTPIETGMAPVLEVPLTPHLPHWRVAVYSDPQSTILRSSNAFLIIAGLLLATLIVAILLGGALLTRQAYANWLDSQQKSSFVSNVSHELKTPLTTIRMYAEILNEGIVRDPEKKAHYLQVIVSEAERLTRLVNNVLGFSRLEQGRMKYGILDLDVVELIQSFLDTNEMRVRESGMSLTCTIPDAPLFVRADRDALEHTFLNIVDNAVKYASEGKSLDMTLSVGGSMCEIRFLDQGPGVPGSHRDKIFEKFQRVDNSLTAGKAGTGLGLTIARKMMRDLGGDLVYEPGAQKGSCFVVCVPLSQGSAAAQEGVS